MDARSLQKKLYPLARFAQGDVVYYKDWMCEVVKRYYRISERRILYDVRIVRLSDVRMGIPQDELLSVGEHQKQV